MSMTEDEKEIILAATEKANKRELSIKEANDLVSKYPKSHRANVVLAFLYYFSCDQS